MECVWSTLISNSKPLYITGSPERQFVKRSSSRAAQSANCAYNGFLLGSGGGALKGTSLCPGTFKPKPAGTSGGGALKGGALKAATTIVGGALPTCAVASTSHARCELQSATVSGCGNSGTLERALPVARTLMRSISLISSSSSSSSAK